MKHKRLLVFLCTLIAAVSLFVFSAAAETSGEWEYYLSDGAAVITAYNGTDTLLVIPSKLDGYTVTGICEYTFKDRTDLVSVEFPSTLEFISAGAFMNCSALTEVTLPENLYSVGSNAFKNCRNLEKLTVKSKRLNSFTIISDPNCAFLNAGINTDDGFDVIFTDTVERIPDGMFYSYNSGSEYAHVKSVSIGKNVTAVGSRAFHNCPDLEIVSFSAATSLNTICDSAFEYCYSLQTLSFPSDAVLERIDEHAFANCNALTEVTLPECLHTVGKGAFNNCRNLEKLMVKSKRLDDFNWYGTFLNAGKNASNRLTVIFTDTVEHIPNYMFYNDGSTSEGYSSIKSVSIGNGAAYIGYRAFENCYDLKEVTLGSAIQTIDEDAFANCTDLSTVWFSGSAPDIAEDAFTAVSANAYYPGNDASWTADMRQDYGGDLSWVAYNALKITSQPKTTYVRNGVTASVSVKAQGDGLTYKWYYKDVGSSKFYRTSVTGNTYSLPMTPERSGRLVYCVITDRYGNSVTTNTVALRLAVTITKQPVNVVVAAGKTAAAKVTAVGDGLTYKWYYKDAGSSRFYRTSVTGNTYGLPMNAARSGRQVYCIVSDRYGHSLKTNTVSLDMPATITAQPKTTYVRNGVTASATVQAVGNGLTYKWYYKDVGSSKFYRASVTGNTYGLPMNQARSGRQVYCVITDRYGNSVTTNTVALRLAVTITKQPVSVAVAAGSTAYARITAVGDGVTYKWYYKDVGSSRFYRTSVTGSTYGLPMNAARDGRQVYCIVTDRYGHSLKSNVVTLSMK